MWASGMLHLSSTPSPEKILECPDTIVATALTGVTVLTSGHRGQQVKDEFCSGCQKVILSTYPEVLLAVAVLKALKI